MKCWESEGSGVPHGHRWHYSDPGNGNELRMWSTCAVLAGSTRRAQDTLSHMKSTHVTIAESRQFHIHSLMLSSIKQDSTGPQTFLAHHGLVQWLGFFWIETGKIRNEAYQSPTSESGPVFRYSNMGGRPRVITGRSRSPGLPAPAENAMSDNHRSAVQ